MTSELKFKQDKIVRTLLVLGCIMCVSSCSQNLYAAASGVRHLSDYKNDDGSTPDGKREDGDDTTALNKALGAGPGVVHIGPGNYRWGNVSVPAGVTVIGAGAATIVRSNGAKQIFSQQEVGEWAIRDMTFLGAATGDWHHRKDDGFDGISATKCWNYELSGLSLQNFNGAGLRLSWNTVTEFRHAGSLSRIFAKGNAIGIHFDERAEYLNASDLACFNNVQGCVINAGNVKISNSSFVANKDGLVIEDKQNGSHGMISSSMINHNERYGLLARNVTFGMIFSDCAFFTGTLQIENSVGINITDSIISCEVKTSGEGFNRFAGNYIIPEKYGFSFSPATIVKDNFTAKGPWQP